MNKEIIKITCKDCGAEFDFTPGEQSFYAEKQLANPIRCKDCRDIRKAKYAVKNAQALSDDDFQKYLLEKFTENTVSLED